MEIINFIIKISKLDSNAPKPIAVSFLFQNTFFDSNIKPKSKELTHQRFYHPKCWKPTSERDDPLQNPQCGSNKTAMCLARPMPWV
jgi:hypothetical protein